MRNLLSKLNADDSGVVTIEYLVLGTILGLGIIVGVHVLTAKINEELTELANAVGSLDQNYSAAGFFGCFALKFGSQASGDQNNPAGLIPLAAPAGDPINVDYCIINN